MREIKFRAWDKIEKKFWRVASIYFSDPNSNNITSLWLEDFCNNTLHKEMKIEDVELVEYTNLKDESGKEIYENDIVETFIELKTDRIYAIEYRRLNLTKVIVDITFSAPSFIFNFSHMYLPVNSSCKVIGNIYENPELLEGK